MSLEVVNVQGEQKVHVPLTLRFCSSAHIGATVSHARPNSQPLTLLDHIQLDK